MRVYKCKHCGIETKVVDDIDEIEEELWGHIQLEHEEVFEEVQGDDTPFMLEECYVEEENKWTN